MVFNRAGLLEVPTDDEINLQGRYRSDGHELRNALYPAAVHAVVLEVGTPTPSRS